jgi:hypothetical protein
MSAGVELFMGVFHREIDLYPVWVNQLPTLAPLSDVMCIDDLLPQTAPMPAFPTSLKIVAPPTTPRVLEPEDDAPIFHPPTSVFAAIAPLPSTPRLGWSFTFAPTQQVSLPAMPIQALPIDPVESPTALDTSLNSSSGSNSSLYCDESSLDSSWNEAALVGTSKSPILDAFLVCLKRGAGAKVRTWDANNFSIDVFDLDRLLDTLGRINRKANPTSERAHRLKSLRRWFNGFPHRFSGSSGDEKPQFNAEEDTMDIDKAPAPLMSTPKKAVLHSSGSISKQRTEASQRMANVWVSRSKKPKKMRKPSAPKVKAVLTLNRDKKDAFAFLNDRVEHLGIVFERPQF